MKVVFALALEFWAFKEVKKVVWHASVSSKKRMYTSPLGGIVQINRVFEPFATASPSYGYGMPILMEAQKKKFAGLKAFKNPIGHILAIMLYA